jgi:hypothetical protein
MIGVDHCVSLCLTDHRLGGIVLVTVCKPQPLANAVMRAGRERNVSCRKVKEVPRNTPNAEVGEALRLTRWWWQ